MPRRSFQPPFRSRSSLVTHPPQRREERPAAATAAEAPRWVPNVRRKVRPGPGKRCQGQRRSPRRNTVFETLQAVFVRVFVRREARNRRPSSQTIQNVARGSRERHSMFVFLQVVFAELFPPHSVTTMQLAPPQSSAEPSSTQRIVAHHLPAHPSTKLLKPLYQSLKAWEVIPGISRWLLGVIKRGYTLQFRRRPPGFKVVVQSLTLPRNRQVLRQEVCNSARKRSDRKSPSEWAGERFFTAVISWYSKETRGSRESLWWPFCLPCAISGKAALFIWRNFRGCWDSWRRLQWYVIWAYYTCACCSYGWNLKSLGWRGLRDVWVSRSPAAASKLWRLWRNPDLFSRGDPLGSVVLRVVVTTDTSTHS